MGKSLRDLISVAKAYNKGDMRGAENHLHQLELTSEEVVALLDELINGLME